MKLSDFGVLSCSVLFNAFAQLGLKSATRVTGPLISSDARLISRVLGLLLVPSFLGALCVYMLSVLIWVIGLSRVPVSQAYPLLSLGYVVNLGLAWWLLGETPSVQRILGIGVIVAGVVLVARSQ